MVDLVVAVVVVRDGPARLEEEEVLVRLRFFWKKASGMIKVRLLVCAAVLSMCLFMISGDGCGAE